MDEVAGGTDVSDLSSHTHILQTKENRRVVLSYHAPAPQQLAKN